MRTAIVIICFAVITWFDLPKLIKKKKKKKAELIVYSVIMGTAFLLSELHVLEFEIWSPNKMLTDLVNIFK